MLKILRVFISFTLLFVFSASLGAEVVNSAQDGFGCESQLNHEGDDSHCTDPCHMGRCHFGHCSLVLKDLQLKLRQPEEQNLNTLDLDFLFAGPILEGPRRPPKFS